MSVNSKKEIKLRDVLFLCHAKPTSREQETIWKKLINGTLSPPNTWEVRISACITPQEKKIVWEDLLSTNKLGGMALIRNLRNFEKVGVEETLVINAIRNMNTRRILPYRFIAAARYAPQLEPYLEEAMIKSLENKPKFPGHTVILLDVSGSMDRSLSAKSDISRLDAACGLGILLREICDRADIFTFSEKVIRVPSRRGFALRDAIAQSQRHSGTYLGNAINSIYGTMSAARQNTYTYYPRSAYPKNITNFGLKPDRLIVLTDEQSHDKVSDPVFGKGYMINVANYKNGVGYGPWTHVDGFSESIVDYIIEYENFDRNVRQ